MDTQNSTLPEFTLDSVATRAAQHLLETGEHLPGMMLIGKDRDDRPLVLVMPLAGLPENQRQRNTLISFAAFKMKKETGIRLERVYHISEAWMLRMKIGEPEPTVRPEQHPDRIESLIVCEYVTADKSTKLKTFDMIRDSKGQLTEIKSVEHDGSDIQILSNSLFTALLKGFGLY